MKKLLFQFTLVTVVLFFNVHLFAQDEDLLKLLGGRRQRKKG